MKLRNIKYDSMIFRRCGRSGIRLPVLSLGLWQNFGKTDPFPRSREIVLRAFESGITHFDLANNYGTPPGSAEEIFGRILRRDLAAHRDEMIISTKAGYIMWNGPYGDWGSRKYLLSSLDQSLKRMGIDFVDIFYSHRFDPETPLEETLSALEQSVRQGKALYVGISNYPPRETKDALRILKDLGIRCLVHQARYSLFERRIEKGLLDVLDSHDVGCVVFSPLAQGLLSDRYLKGIPPLSRAEKMEGVLKTRLADKKTLPVLWSLDTLARDRGQSLSQMALAWTIRDPHVTSAIMGVSGMAQLEANLRSLERLDFSEAELRTIDRLVRAVPPL